MFWIITSVFREGELEWKIKAMLLFYIFEYAGIMIVLLVSPNDHKTTIFYTFTAYLQYSNISLDFIEEVLVLTWLLTQYFC